MNADTAEMVTIQAGTRTLVCTHERGQYCGRRATRILHVTYSPSFGGGSEKYACCDVHPAGDLQRMIQRSDPQATFEITGAP